MVARKNSVALAFLLLASLMALDKAAESVGIPADLGGGTKTGEYSTLVSVTPQELRRICSLCEDCSMCSVNMMEDSAEKQLDGHKLEIHMVDTDPNPESRRKRLVDLTKPARYHCGKCPTCYCYYRAWRG